MKAVGEIESTKFQVCHQAQKTSQPKHAGRGPGSSAGSLRLLTKVQKAWQRRAGKD